MSTSTKTRRPSKTIEEKKAQAEALHNSISDQVEQLRNTERWTAFLDFATAFHAYSLNNLLLILSQRPEASQVAGFRKWQSLGRQVRKGETGIRIFGYSTKKIIEEDENGDEVEKRIARFPILSVFDIGQTEVVDGAEDPGTITQQLIGTDDFGIVDALSTYLVEEGWTVEHRPIQGRKNGYTDPEEMAVVIDSDLSPEHMAKTLIHETAHVLLEHTEDMAEYVEHRGLMETEAESVAYVVAGLVGFDTSAYSVGYIAGWADGDTDLIKSTAARVLRTAHQIAEILDPGDDNTDDGEAE
ncbi:MAG: ArdC-like ssDNA-binding domain-containing protein [Leifsonia sp.]